MKKGLFFTVLLFLGVSIFAQSAKYAMVRLPDGMRAYSCETENDALILLNNYNLPNSFILVIPMKGISVTDPFGSTGPSESGVYMLNGSKLARPKDYGYTGGLAVMSEWYFDLNQNTEYKVGLHVTLHPLGAQNSSPNKYLAVITNITDMNGHVIPKR